MIRPMKEQDLDAVLQIWLEGNREAHSFIPAAYWEENLPAVRQALPQADVRVYEDADGVQGFVGVQDENYIAGLFVRAAARGKGVGAQLLNHVKAGADRLTLHVYEKNVRAVKFYERENFHILAERADGCESEYCMLWGRFA